MTSFEDGWRHLANLYGTEREKKKLYLLCTTSFRVVFFFSVLTTSLIIMGVFCFLLTKVESNINWISRLILTRPASEPLKKDGLIVIKISRSRSSKSEFIFELFFERYIYQRHGAVFIDHLRDWPLFLPWRPVEHTWHSRRVFDKVPLEKMERGLNITCCHSRVYGRRGPSKVIWLDTEIYGFNKSTCETVRVLGR